MPRTYRKTRVPDESTSIMDFLSIRITDHSVIAVAEHRRRGCPVRQPSPKKSPSFRMAIVALPALRHNGEFYLSFLYVKNSIGRVALNKDRLLFGKSCDLPTAVGRRGHPGERRQVVFEGQAGVECAPRRVPPWTGNADVLRWNTSIRIIAVRSPRLLRTATAKNATTRL